MNEAPKLSAPPGSCDTHMHFYDQGVPLAPGGPTLPGHYSVPMTGSCKSGLAWSG